MARRGRERSGWWGGARARAAKAWRGATAAEPLERRQAASERFLRLISSRYDLGRGSASGWCRAERRHLSSQRCSPTRMNAIAPPSLSPTSDRMQRCSWCTTERCTASEPAALDQKAAGESCLGLAGHRLHRSRRTRARGPSSRTAPAAVAVHAMCSGHAHLRSEGSSTPSTPGASAPPSPSPKPEAAIFSFRDERAHLTVRPSPAQAGLQS